MSLQGICSEREASLDDVHILPIDGVDLGRLPECHFKMIVSMIQ